MEKPPGVMIAPNSASIRARIVRVEHSTHMQQKWVLEMEIREVRQIHGPQRAQPGMQARASTVCGEWNLPLPVEVEADAEYVGGPHQGEFALTNLRVCG